MAIEDYFRSMETVGNHPLLRFVAARQKAGDLAVFQLHRPRETMGFRKAKIYIHLIRADQEVDCKQDDWDDDLNTGLIHLGVKSRTSDEEKDRFVLGLRAALRQPEKRFGDGYFSSVLVQVLLESDFYTHPDVAAALNHVPHSSPHQGRSYPECVGMIDEAIRGRAVELSGRLNYERLQAWEVLAGAMAGYLDERFSVTSRRLLGLL